MSNDSVIQKKPPVKALVDRLESLRVRGLLAIVKRICAAEGASIEDVFGDRRSAHITRARRTVWWELHDRGWNYVEIGRFFGRNHASIIKGVATAAQELGLVGPARRTRERRAA